MVRRADWPKAWQTRSPVWYDVGGLQSAPNNFPSNWRMNSGASSSMEHHVLLT